MRHLTLTIRSKEAIRKLEDLYLPFNTIENVSLSESVICRWLNVDALFASHVMQTVFNMPEVGSMLLSETKQ